MRLAPMNALVGSLLDFSASDDGVSAGPKYNLGAILDAAPTDGVDTGTNVPNWGMCTLLRVRSTSASTFALGRLVHIDKDYTILDVPNTAGTGKLLGVVLSAFAAGNVTTQYGWILLSGIAPVQYAVAATAGLLYVGGAGQATPTQANGKQILNASCLIAAASAFTRTVQTVNGSKQVRFSRSNGMFVGEAISGTGIPGGATIAAIDPSGQALTLSAAATATGSVTGTFTPTGFGIVHFNSSFVQGQIV